MERNLSTGSDPYIGLEVGGYKLIELIGKGGIGAVYRATKESLRLVVACKVIPQNKLKNGWEHEIEKAAALDGVPGVVTYKGHGPGLNNNNETYVWILWTYVQGCNLRQLVEEHPEEINMAFIQNLTRTVLNVLVACKNQQIAHDDLHEGNILISNPDSNIRGRPRRIWITDFGYGGSRNDLKPKDDYIQASAIVRRLLHTLNFDELNIHDRIMYEKMMQFTIKIMEKDQTQGEYVCNPEELLNILDNIIEDCKRESLVGERTEGSIKDPGDYLWAEAIGFRADEWRSLFVPEFLGVQDLLKNTTAVLTGARGCGKTMAFRRLTAYMDKIVGESGVPGADQFVGFYLNCRDLVEAFPWLPDNLNIGTQQQILHFFHTAWLIEIARTLEAYRENGEDFIWLDELIIDTFSGRYCSPPQGTDILCNIQSFLESEKERCRISPLGKTEGLDVWPLARLDLLDVLHTTLIHNCIWIEQKPIYLFLDDYSTPYVPKSVQKVLNPVLFKRRSMLCFKISTESTNSFERSGLHEKTLEARHDFEIIDLAALSLHYDEKMKEKLLDDLFRRRINRHPLLKNKEIGLVDLLGRWDTSNNQLAWNMRRNAGNREEDNEMMRVKYYGVESFVGMWSSDTRTLIQTFISLLRGAESNFQKGESKVPNETQNRVYRAAGADFLSAVEFTRDPLLVEQGPVKPTEHYGKHIKEIVQAIVDVSRYEMISGNLINNQGTQSPRQAFRIEIIDAFEPTPTAERYLEGMIRWHILMQDRRGKSIRGMITPRLYLNRIVIPFCLLTFSKHDSISMTNWELCMLIDTPGDFYKYWKGKRSGGPNMQLCDPIYHNEGAS